jgi:hypothetical protein
MEMESEDISSENMATEPEGTRLMGGEMVTEGCGFPALAASEESLGRFSTRWTGARDLRRIEKTRVFALEVAVEVVRGRGSEVELVVWAFVGVGVEFFGGEARDASFSCLDRMELDA